jgi:hypothetical protein
MGRQGCRANQGGYEKQSGFHNLQFYLFFAGAAAFAARPHWPLQFAPCNLAEKMEAVCSAMLFFAPGGRADAPSPPF